MEMKLLLTTEKPNTYGKTKANWYFEIGKRWVYERYVVKQYYSKLSFGDLLVLSTSILEKMLLIRHVI